MESKTKILLGFLIAIVLLGLLIFGVGWSSLLRVISSAEPFWIIASIFSAFICFFLWALSWRNIIIASGNDVSIREIIPIFFSGIFANNITPLGQAGGEVASAYILSYKTDIDYEESFATAMTVDILNLIPFFAFSIFGIIIFFLSTGIGDNLAFIMAGSLLMSIVILLLFIALFTRQEFFEKLIVKICVPISKVLKPISNKWSNRFRRKCVLEKTKGFYETISYIRSNIKRLAGSIGLTLAGWVFFVSSIVFTFFSLGLSLPLVMAFLIVAVGAVLSFTPLPGGTGGLEIGLTLVISSTIGLSLEVSSAIALLFRFATYWIPLMIGGIVSVYFTLGKRIFKIAEIA